MSRPTVQAFHQTRSVENGVFVIREIGRNNLAEEVRLMTLLDGLEEAEHRLQALDDLQESEAYADVEVAATNLRNAKLRLEEIQRRNLERQRIEGQQSQILGRFRELWASEAKTLNEIEREFAEDASALGITYLDPELLACSPRERETL